MEANVPPHADGPPQGQGLHANIPPHADGPPQGQGLHADGPRQEAGPRRPDQGHRRDKGHLRWPWLDWLEAALMALCGLILFGFCVTVSLDIITRTIGRPWLWLQEVTSTLFVYGIFIGFAAATRRNDHLYLTAVAESLRGRARQLVEIVTRLVVLSVALCMLYFGYRNFLRGFGSFRLPSNTPIASLYAAIPLSGVLIALFAIEQIVNGWRHGFEQPAQAATPHDGDVATALEAMAARSPRRAAHLAGKASRVPGAGDGKS